MRDSNPKHNEFIFILDPKGRISFLGARSLSGCPSGDLLGRHYSCVFNFKDQPDILQRFLENRKGIESKEPIQARFFAGKGCGVKTGFGTVEIRSNSVFGKVAIKGGPSRFSGVWGTARFVSEERKSISLPFESRRSYIGEAVSAPQTEKDPVEKERRRIAMELHDGVGQILTALKMDVERASMKLKDRDPELSALLDAAAEKSRKAIREIKAVSESLAPAPLARLGLCGALYELCSESETSYGIKVQFVSDMGCERLSPPTRLTVYRVAQEALSNALAHSEAGTIRISLSQRPQAVSLTVLDDGKGFDISAVSGQDKQTFCHGLAIMRKRAQSLGGTFHIRSDSDSGTMVMMELPVHDAAFA